VKFDRIFLCGLGKEVFFPPFECYRSMDVRINVICTDLILTKCLIDILYLMRSMQYLRLNI